MGPTKMVMYYHSFDQRKGKFVVGAATSRDGMKWDKQGPIFEVSSRRWLGAEGAAGRQCEMACALTV